LAKLIFNSKVFIIKIKKGILQATMAIRKTTILVFFIALIASFYCPAASAEHAVKEFRIGIIGDDPGQLLHDFVPFLEYLRSSLRPSGILNVSVFVARDLDQLRNRIQKGSLDFILTSAFPLLTMESYRLVPDVVALQGGLREDDAVFFVRKQNSLQNLGDLRGKTIVCGTPSSTAAYAMAIAEMKENRLSISESTDKNAPDDAVRYMFVGEAINQAFSVIRQRADAGVFSSSDWEALPPSEQSRLRVIHRTAPITRLLGSFHPSFPQVRREVVEKALFDMSGNRKGRAALAAALNMTKFERLTEEDSDSLQRLKFQLSAACES
jgi:ABC-type phosphate/phosphonate transport system substrate-binding protein